MNITNKIISYFCFTIIAFLFSVTGSFSQKQITANANPAPGVLIMYDTIQAGWMEAAPGRVSYIPFNGTDNKGNIYALIEMTPEIVNFCILENGKWKSLETEIQTGIFNMITDMQGTACAITENAVYRKTGDQWKKIAGDSTKIFRDGSSVIRIYQVQPDGIIYGVRKHHKDWSKNTLVKWDGKKWIDIKHTSGIIEFSDRPEMAVDKKGTVYFSENKSGIVKSLTGDQLKISGQMPYQVYALGADANGNIYATGGYNDNFYFKKWDGNKWTDVAMPGELKDPRSISNNIRFHSGKVYVFGFTSETNLPKNEKVLFRLDNNSWLRIGYSNGNFSNNEEPVLANGILYAVNKKTKVLSKMETGKIIRREIYPFTFDKNVESSKEIQEKLNSFRLIKEGNKFGVINNNGKTIIYPAFDQIKISSNPHNKTKTVTYPIRDAAFCLINNAEIYYTPLDNYEPDPSRLPGAFEEKKDKCSACNGKGSIGGINKTETVQGKWVEGSTSTTTRPSTMGGNQTTITTTPGYRESSTTKVSGKTAIVSCNKCRGKGEFVKGWKEFLEYNAISKTYIKKRINFSD